MCSRLVIAVHLQIQKLRQVSFKNYFKFIILIKIKILAAAAQSQVVYKNLSAVIEGKEPYVNYDGYASWYA
jgi:hypothetical protein